LQVLVEFAKEDADSEKELDEQFPELVENRKSGVQKYAF
jgi:peptide chain release factor 2